MLKRFTRLQAGEVETLLMRLRDETNTTDLAREQVCVLVAVFSDAQRYSFVEIQLNESQCRVITEELEDTLRGLVDKYNRDGRPVDQLAYLMSVTNCVDHLKEGW